MILDLIIRCLIQLQERSNYIQTKQAEAQQRVDKIASIPYHTVENVHAFMNQDVINPEQISPGKPVGGLLLTQPLYILSN
jgi:NADH:ubiquinone oxidoreductase subunit E